MNTLANFRVTIHIQRKKNISYITIGLFFLLYFVKFFFIFSFIFIFIYILLFIAILCISIFTIYFICSNCLYKLYFYNLIYLVMFYSMNFL